MKLLHDNQILLLDPDEQGDPLELYMLPEMMVLGRAIYQISSYLEAIQDGAVSNGGESAFDNERAATLRRIQENCLAVVGEVVEWELRSGEV